MRLCHLTERGMLRVGDRVCVTPQYRMAYRRSRATFGTLLHFCNRTECRVQFDNIKHSVQIDERFLEPTSLLAKAA